LRAILDLINKARQSAHQLVKAGLPVAALELAEQVGLARVEFNERERKRHHLAKYHEKRATECDGPTRTFHLEAVEMLRERDS
jgi:hypothetical protein